MALAEIRQENALERTNLQKILSQRKDMCKAFALWGSSLQVFFVGAISTMNPENLEKTNDVTKSLETFIACLPTIIFFGAVAYFKFNDRAIERNLNAIQDPAMVEASY